MPVYSVWTACWREKQQGDFVIGYLLLCANFEEHYSVESLSGNILTLKKSTKAI